MNLFFIKKKLINKFCISLDKTNSFYKLQIQRKRNYRNLYKVSYHISYVRYRSARKRRNTKNFCISECLSQTTIHPGDYGAFVMKHFFLIIRNRMEPTWRLFLISFLFSFISGVRELHKISRQQNCVRDNKNFPWLQIT